ncbi:MAG: hypothetical protein ACLQDQ_04445 [Myxococcaceae bacterium]
MRPLTSGGVLVLALLGCVSEPRPVAESRPPAFIGTPGPAKPDGCPVQLLLSRRDRPAQPIEDIATVSAMANTLEECKQQLVVREACRYGGDVLYVFETGQASVGLSTPVVWCAAKLARLLGPPSAR